MAQSYAWETRQTVVAVDGFQARRGWIMAVRGWLDAEDSRCP